ncbi:GNAT family N-acetyltransferase [Salipaludibacillus keqinensis]|uniref:GNAT family N-acetyltransferase n=1 Tax=Salipaludibacillus keqinensis TaxID=2045207 RepID=A0A323TA75_9BACI|nr:GNAT family N-acetyltransferase [Salipaludibacillus keqinensis]PYZ91940.1 GNAT family N-acetyltransferase [Salipaludibacillus keqinensis]
MSKKEKTFDLCAESDRLILRPLEEEDYKNWLTEFKARKPSHHRHDEGKRDMSICSENWFVNLVKKHQQLALTDESHIFAVFRKKDGKHLGMVDFSTLERNDFQWGRIGYMIHNQHWKNGYGHESVKLAVDLAFNELKFHRIEAHINTDNEASIRLAKSVGMSYECTRKGFIYEFGGWTDNLIYYMNSNTKESI